MQPNHRNRKVSRVPLRAGALASLISYLAVGHAVEVVPEAGSILRNIKPESILPGNSQVPFEISEQPAPAGESDIRIQVKGWKISGAVLISEADLQSFLKDYIGKDLNLLELRKITRDIAAYYQQRGFFARALLPAQQIRDGIVEILIREATLGKVEVDDSANTYRNDIPRQTMLAAQPAGEALRLADMQRGILLLNDLTGGTVSSTLKAGARAGESDLLLKIDPSNLISGSVDYSNTGVRSVGMNQFGGSLNLNNPLRLGDLATLRVQGGSGNVYGRVAYSLPVGYSGLRVGLAASALDYTLGEPFQSLDAQGSAWTGGTFATYPLLRGVSTNLYVASGFDDRHYYNTSLASVVSDKEVQSGYVGLSGDHQDDWLGGAVTLFGATMVAGNLDLSGSPVDQAQNRATARAGGAYQKFSLNASRLQGLTDKLRLYAGFSGQLATKNLDSSEKFSLGGPFGIRAYPVNEALGDEGYLMNFELRYEVYEHVELVGFIDHGGITLHNDLWSNATEGVPNHYTLSGGGVGINWTVPGNFVIRGSVAQRIGANPARSTDGNDSDGTYKTPHFWVSLSKAF
ncbi:ShlB/FhaC/HecB family hemolysin secretion/activation protein [Methylococcaceae bacterium WWC4]|nr:ShlB/FhaC/HecB family hemolysin secretion/activation protein [Methylococcaceae bacterium WWC4]